MTVEEKRRELFERDIHAQASRRNEVGDYVLPSIQDRWAGFNAALDAIEIELPSGFTHHTGADYTAYVMDADQVVEAIESLNLGIKIK